MVFETVFKIASLHIDTYYQKYLVANHIAKWKMKECRNYLLKYMCLYSQSPALQADTLPSEPPGKLIFTVKYMVVEIICF